ncbi:hypothetical protein [Acinetobacter lwoffii]|uniref:hypothetical protein n=1 Tax=Acinetobacter lwoffii TaxID=28090 RepID=UPI002DBD5487|nr:hypothetical protein [Acinetobacter lwoffii]MEB6681146.1 hypothetical protein [Acinetobacter lwoffii]
MNKPKPKPLLERLPFPNLRSPSLFSSSLPEEERLRHEAEVKAHNDAEMEHINQLALFKMLLLLKHHEIDVKDPNRWFLLATKLAQQYEPGLQMQTAPSGRTNKWNFIELLGLYTLVEYLCEKKELSVSNACDIIKNKYLSNLKVSKKTLENKYLDAKKNEKVIKWYTPVLEIDHAKESVELRNLILEEAFNIRI